MSRCEAGVAERLYHPEYFNHDADPERSTGIERKGDGGLASLLFRRRLLRGERIIVEDDLAAAYVMMRGTHEGGLPPGIPATPFAVKHVHLIRCAEDGRLLEHRAVRDDLGPAMQAGLLPPPPRRQTR
jgi:hypothetical protein